MKLSFNPKSKDPIYYLAKTVRVNNKTRTKNIARIGKHSELLKMYSDPKEYAKNYVIEANQKNKKMLEDNFTVQLICKELQDEYRISQSKSYNIGYFYLKSILDKLNLRKFFRAITKDSKLEFSPLLATHFMTYARILDPKSKHGSFDDAKTYYGLEQIQLQHLYRTLDILAKHSVELQTHLFNESQNIVKRDTEVLYYDCTNFYFETNEEDELIKYGQEKKHRPNPIVQMGLFMDKNSLPLSFSISPGNTNEQVTAIPLEKQIVKNMNVKEFIYVADAGLNSNQIRLYNSFNNRYFIVTQSLKLLRESDKSLVLTNENWFDPITLRSDINLDNLPENDENIYYKVLIINRPIDIGLRETLANGTIKKKTDFKQNLIVAFSKKQQLFQRQVRERQFDRALKMIKNNQAEKTTENSPKRFIKVVNGKFEIDYQKLEEEKRYDGFYGIVTNLDREPYEIIKIVKSRWQIEDCFKIMKTNFKSRPVYHYKHERILAHFIICFIALLVFRILEYKLNKKYSINDIIKQLKTMTVSETHNTFFTANYTGSSILKDLDSIFNKNLELSVYTNLMLNEQKEATQIK